MASPPDTPNALKAAEAAISKGDLQAALDAIAPLETLDPIPEACHRLAVRIAAAQDDPTEALRRLDLAIEAAGRTTTTDLMNRAQYCHVAGRLDEAIETLGRIPNTIEPRTQAAAIFLRTRCEARLGRIEDARSSIRDLIKLEGRALRSQWLIAEVNATAGDHEGARDRYAAILGDRKVPTPIRITVAFGLARACDRLGDASSAFEAASLGNRLLNPTFDADAHRRETSAIIEWSTPGNLEAMKRSGSTDQRPVFVVGLPRSGTSLLEQIVASHPRGAGVGERRDPVFAAARIAHLVGRPWPECLGTVSTDRLDDVATNYASMLDRSGFDADRIVNKALGLDRVLPGIAAMFPDARVVVIDRDPRDQIVSSFLHQLRGPGLEWASRLEDLVVARTEHDRLVDHFMKVLPLPIHRVRYEELVADQVGTTEALLAFLGLDPDPACLAFHEHRRAVMTPSFDQVDKPLTDSAVGRWRAFESRLEPVLEAFPPES